MTPPIAQIRRICLDWPTKEKQMARFVLVHGGFSGAWIWLPLLDRLKADGHVVEAFDLPGMGNDNSTDSRRTHLQALGE
jgi:alpha-beta hydrolase superfamily lysophospholipase